MLFYKFGQLCYFSAITGTNGGMIIYPFFNDHTFIVDIVLESLYGSIIGSIFGFAFVPLSPFIFCAVNVIIIKKILK